jgi:L-cysteate sulfo-lyase
MKFPDADRISLANLPTPLVEMSRISKALGGPRLFIKRDDLTGLSFGGNKARKLEYVMADALRRRANVIITAGGLQSNWAQMTTAAASRLGMRTILVLRMAQFSEVPTHDGNMLLDHLIGADIRIVQGSIKDALEAGRVMEETAEEERKNGSIPYVAAVGGDTPLGTLGYVMTVRETQVQLKETRKKIDHIAFASASGGTQAGLVLGVKRCNMDTRVLGLNVGVMDTDLLKDRTVKLANRTAKLLESDFAIDRGEIEVTQDYPGYAEYGVLTKETVDAIRVMAKTEGIFLDPVYTGKAFAGLMHLIREGHFYRRDNVMFIHTGGIAALFPYKKELHQSNIR